MNTSILKPGILVSLKSTVSGGVQYKRVDLENLTQDGMALSKWETTRVIEDPAEHEQAVKARGKALATIRSICAVTTFGLLCPVDREAELDAALLSARAIVDAHNASASFTRVAVYILKGRIASTDEEAARAIREEITTIVGAMNSGIDRLDPVAIREAAAKAQAMSAMLGEEQVQAVTGAIEQARKAARQIVKRIQKDAEPSAIVLADIQRGAIEKARIAFLDFDQVPSAEQSEPAMPAVNVQRMGDLDMGEHEQAEREAIETVEHTEGS